jgi:hypothetical protein
MTYNHEIYEDFKFDFIKWIENKFENLEVLDKAKSYRFFIPKSRLEVLEKQFKNNKSTNLNSKLRDMTVYASASQFLYDVETVKY